MFLKDDSPTDVGAIHESPHLISPDYLAAQKALHNHPRGYGNSGRKHAAEVGAMAAVLGARSILDYGAGGGTLRTTMLAQCYPQPWADRFGEYDPAIDEISASPTPAHLVTCTDVLEHIEPDRIDAVLAHLRSLTLKAAYCVISTQPSHKHLRDGRNAHLIIESPEWWTERVKQAGFQIRSRFVRSNEEGVAEVALWLS